MDITASYLTLAGSRFGQATVHGIAERSRAAQSAGYTGIGATAAEVQGCDLPAVAASLQGAPVTELEWYDLGQPDKGTRDTLLAMAGAFGATRVNVGVCQSAQTDSDAVITERLKAFADAAGEHGLTVAVEPVAFGYLWHTGRVLDIATAAGRPNVGLLYDTWQVHRAVLRGAPHDVPGYCVAEVQLAGYGQVTDDVFGDSQDRRGLPDPCCMADLAGLQASGFTGPVDVECAMATLRAMPCVTAATITYDRCQPVTV